MRKFFELYPTLLALFPALLCCSCVAPQEKWTSDLVVPPTWNGTKSGTVSDQNATTSKNQQPLNTSELKNWWKRFNDPVLDSLITRALASSPDMKTALSRIAEARAERRVTKSGLLPAVTASASDRTQRQDQQNLGITTNSASYSASLDASWEIDLFGKQLQNLAASTDDVAQTVENFYAAQVTLSSDVAKNYITLRGAQTRLEVVRQNIATQTQTAEITKWRQEAGLTDMLQVQQSVSTLEQAQASIPTLQQTVEETRNQLALLCGQTPGSLDKLLAQSGRLPKVPAKLAVGVPAQALNHRPDVRASLNAVSAAYHRKSSAELERLPTINLSASFGLEALKTGSIFSPDSAARTLVGSLVAGLTQPIFEGGRINANIDINKELASQAVYSYQSTVLTALSEVENAFVAIRRLTERLEVLRRADEAATEASKLATQQYEAGTIDLLTVLDVQRTQLSVDEQRADTETSQIQAYIQLYKALGGGWQPL